MTRRSGGEAGFTLVETMIALAILAIGLGMMLRSTASNIFAAQRAQMMTSAVNLARAKMYDIEESLLTDGFPEMDQSDEGTFSEEGWPQISWKSEVVKIELPDMSTLQGMAGKEGEAGATGEPAAPAGGGLLGGMLGGVGGMDPNSVAGAGIMGTYYTLISDVLKDAIRKVTLTISYDVAGDHESMVVTCYFTDPGAIARKIPGVGGAATGAEGEEGGQQGGGQQGGGQQGGGQQGGRNPNPSPTATPTPRGGGETR